MNSITNLFSGLRGVICLLLLVCSSLLASPPTSVGQRVQANATVNVRGTAAGSALGQQLTGAQGTTIGGPTLASLSGVSYTWWNVNWDSGTDGFVASIGIDVIASIPAAPTANSPGTSAAPGTTVTTTNPVLSWNRVSGATSYQVQVSREPYGAANIVYSNLDTGDVGSIQVSSGLVSGVNYRWNIYAKNSAGSSSISNTLYFNVQTSTPPTVATVSGVSPNPAIGSNSPQTFQILGSNFVSGAVVTLSATGSYPISQANTTFISSSRIDVLATTANDPFTWSARVTNPGASTSNSVNFSVNAPAPVISSISPNTVVVGSGAINLSVYGSTFHPGSIVKWNGANLSTTPTISAGGLTQALTAVVPSSLLSNVASASVTVFSPGPGGGTSSATGFTISSGGGGGLVSKPAVIWNPAAVGNFGSRPSGQIIDTIIVHTTEGSYGSAVNWFKDPASKVSAHYVISPSGEITQMVTDVNRAFHATYYNDRAIGIEMAGYAGSASTWNSQNLAALESLCAFLCQQHGISASHPTTDANSFPNFWFAGTGLIGHTQIQPSPAYPRTVNGTLYSLKTDPGIYFPWASFVTNVQAKLSGGTAASLVINSIAPSSTQVLPGATFQIEAQITSTSSRGVIQGASLVVAGSEDNFISDPANDTVSNIQSGTNGLSRNFRIPTGTAPGAYDLLYALWADSNADGVINTGDSVIGSTFRRSNAIQVMSGSTVAANDNFANATAISGSFVSLTTSSVGATKESGEPNHVFNTGGASLWWKWTAPQNGTLVLDTLTSSFDTVLAVYTGSNLGSLLYVRGNDDAPNNAGAHSFLSMEVVGGTVYHIAIDGYGGASGTLALALQFTATVTSKIIALSGDLHFGNVLLGETASRSVTISNTGNTALTVSEILLPSAFTCAWSGVISPGETQTTTVTFSPVAVGTYSGSLSAISDRTGGSNTLAVSGVGIVPQSRIISLSGSLAFGNLAVGSTASATMNVANSGNNPLNITAISYPAGFSGNWVGSIPAGSTQPVTVTFTPTAAVSYTGTVSVSGNQTAGTNSIAISGIGVQPITRIIGLSGSLAFGSVEMGRSKTLSVTISNSGNTKLAVSSITLPSGFTTNWSQGLIAPGATQVVNVTFTPTSLASIAGGMAVNSDKTSGVATLSISATGAPKLQIKSLTRTPAGVAVITFPGKAGTTYTLQRSPDLKSWFTVTSITPQTDGDFTLQDAQPIPLKGFYRISH